MEIKALFLDIDGTLVSVNTHRIPESTVKALEIAKANGVKIFIATGRAKSLIDNLGQLQERGLIDGFITMNGAYCYVGDEVIHKSFIPLSEVMIIARQCEKIGCSCVLSSERKSYLYQPTELFTEVFYKSLNVAPIDVADSLEMAISGDILQMSPFLTVEDEAEIKEELPHCEIGRWHPTFLDVSAVGNTKQGGIDVMREYFGIELEQTMCFGDGGNDIGMLQHAGIGVAMGNASDEIKSYGDYVTSSIDEDGIWNGLKHFGVI